MGKTLSDTPAEPKPITIFDGEELRWRDTRGVVHAVEGAVSPPEGWLLWTRCHLHDVVDSKAFASDEHVSCIVCRIMMA